MKLLKFSVSPHKLVKLVLVVIREVAFIFIEQNINILINKVRSHFPTFI
jgi:hypothetical protein